jgi:hypothetical protein
MISLPDLDPGYKSQRDKHHGHLIHPQAGVPRMLDVELHPPPQLGRSGDLIVGQIAPPHLADHLGASLPVAPWRRTYAESRGLDEGRRPIETAVARLDRDAHRRFLVEADIAAERGALAMIGKTAATGERLSSTITVTASIWRPSVNAASIEIGTNRQPDRAP